MFIRCVPPGWSMIPWRTVIIGGEIVCRIWRWITAARAARAGRMPCFTRRPSGNGYAGGCDLTEPDFAPIFRTTASAVAPVALVTLTVTGAIVFTEARCVCGRVIMGIPGVIRVEVRRVTVQSRSGRGRVVSCRRCATLCEVIEHV